MVKTIRQVRPRILFKAEDFIGTKAGDSLRLRVWPTGRDKGYSDPMELEIPVSWWNSQSYVHTRDWLDRGVYSFPKPLNKLRPFITKTL
jgi:hypothetical protein